MLGSTIQKLAIPTAFGCLHVVSAGCGSVLRPLGSVEAENPDKRLFDRAMNSIYDSRLEESRTLLDTLINTYPESEYVTRAKLTLDDIWYVEGGVGPRQETIGAGGGLTFFPPLIEAVEIPKATNLPNKEFVKLR